MPREIKTPIRYIMEDITPVRRTVPAQSMIPADTPVLKPKRGRPRTVGMVREPVATPPLPSRPSPRKSSESIIIPDDDDSDLEIIEPPKSNKRKKDDDPDWGFEKKSKTHRSSRVQDRARREKLQTSIPPPVPTAAAATTPTATVAPKGQTPSKSFTVELLMECREEPLSLAQLTAMKKEQAQYELSQSLVKAAREGRLIFLPDGGTKILDKPIPPPAVAAVAPSFVAALPPTPSPGLVRRINLHNRSLSPDLLIVGETPPKLTTPITPISPALANVNRAAPVNRESPVSRVTPVNTAVPAITPPPPVTLVQGTYGLGIKLPTGWQMVPVTTPATPAVNDTTPATPAVKDRTPATPAVKERTPAQAHSRNATPKSVTSLKTKVQSEAVTPPRQQVQQVQPRTDSEAQKKKLKKQAASEEDESGNWVPLDEYYYGKMEGNPTYQEAKGEHRFKCWYCNKMLYNNVAAMMHIQGHIDSERQVNLDLSDLTQCKHCYKQFDTPFEMQTHIEKVHMNNANVLLCRICERNHDSRQALKEHMRKSHNACEMPYICQLCKFRSSMYSDVVDHFKKKHNGSDAVLCMYCLRVFHVKFVSQGWGQTSIFYNHLMKHQVKNSCKKCQLCRLVFLNLGDVKMHRKMDHLPNQKGVIGMNAKYTTPDQVMIKVTEKTELSLAVGGVKSLNVPAVKKIMEHRLSFPPMVSKKKCIECQMLMGIPDHYKKFIQCSMCRFATSCSFAYSNHMMGFHSGQMTAAAKHTPDESKLKSKRYCSCGFASIYGNRIANHLVFCSKSSCFKDPPPPCAADEFGQELQDPRKKPDASLLDVLGLIKKDSLPPLSARTPHLDTPASEPVEMPAVPLSAKVGKKPLLLRDSLKKPYKSALQIDKDKNIFERVKFGGDSLSTDKQRDSVDLAGLKRDGLKKVSQSVSGETTPRDDIDSQVKPRVEEKAAAAETVVSDEIAIERSGIIQQENAAKTPLTKLANELNDILRDPSEKENDSAEAATIEDCHLVESGGAENESNGAGKEVNNTLGDASSERQEIVRNEGVESESAKSDNASDSGKNNGIDKDSAKLENNDSLKNQDVECESDSHSTESELTKTAHIDDSCKIDDVDSVLTKPDGMESESVQIDDAEGESAKIDGVERQSAKIDDVEKKSAKIDDSESESAKIVDEEGESAKNDGEKKSAKIDDVESEPAKIGDIESESAMVDDTESDSTKINNGESESVQIDNVESESAKIDDVEKKSAKTDDVESESAKLCDMEDEAINIDDVESESAQIDDVESESAQTDDVESEASKLCDVEDEATKIGDVEDKITEIGNVEKESAKIDDIESETNKTGDVESQSTRIGVDKSEASMIVHLESGLAKNGDVEDELTNNVVDRELTENEQTEYESATNDDDVEMETVRNADIAIVSPKGHELESESFKNEDIESARNDDTEIEFTNNDDFENESAKNDDIRCESPKSSSVEAGSVKNNECDIELATEDASLEEVKNADTEGESDHNAECEAASHGAENVKDSGDSDSGHADIVSQDIEDDSAYMTSVEVKLDEEEIANDGQSQYHEDTTELCTIRDKASETDVLGGSESLIKDIVGSELSSIPTDVEPCDDTSAQSNQQEHKDKDNSSGNSEMLTTSFDSHLESETPSKHADLEDSLAQQDNSRTEEASFTCSDGNVIGASDQETLLSSQGAMSQNSCVSQGGDGDDGDRQSSSMSSPSANQDGGREVRSPTADLKISTGGESLMPYSSIQPHQTQSEASHLHREPSVSSSAQSHSRSDRSHQRRSRSRSQDRRRERRSRSRDRDHDRDWHRNRDRDRYRDYHDDRDHYNRDRYRDQIRERDRHRDGDRSRERNRSRERDHSREGNYSRDQDKNRDRDYYRYKDDRRYR